MKRPPLSLFRWIAVGLSLIFVFVAFIMFTVFAETRCSSNNSTLESATCPSSSYVCSPIMKASRQYYDLGASLTITCGWSRGTLGLALISCLFSFAFIALIFVGLRKKSMTLVNMRILLGFVGSVLMLCTFIITAIELHEGGALPANVTTPDTKTTYTRAPYNGNVALVFLSFFFLSGLSIFDFFTYHKNMSAAVQPDRQIPVPETEKAVSPGKETSPEKPKSPEKGSPIFQHNEDDENNRHGQE